MNLTTHEVNRNDPLWTLFLFFLSGAMALTVIHKSVKVLIIQLWDKKMKKRMLVTVIGCVLSVGTAMASDTAATLSVTGALIGDNANCTPSLDRTVADLGQASIDSLPYIGTANASAPAEDTFFVVFSGAACETGNYGVKFLGTPDETGQALGNTLSGDIAASGVGVNIYDSQGHIISPNNSIKEISPVYHGRFPFHLMMAKQAGAQAEAGNVQAALTVEVVKL